MPEEESGVPPMITAELPTTDFGVWAGRSRLVLPVPLNSGYAARVTLPWEELLEVSEDRIEVSNARPAGTSAGVVAGGSGVTAAAARAARAARDLPAKVVELLAHAEPILRNPRACVFAARTEGSGASTLVVGLSRGGRGLVVVDTESSVRLVKVDASDLAASVMGVFPPVSAARLEPVEMNDRAMEIIGAGIGPRGLDRRGAAGLAAGGIPQATADVLVRLHAGSRARGMIGALTHTEGAPIVSELDAMWFEGAPGAVLKRTIAPGVVRFEPATRAALVSAAIGAMSGAR